MSGTKRTFFWLFLCVACLLSGATQAYVPENCILEKCNTGYDASVAVVSTAYDSHSNSTSAYDEVTLHRKNEGQSYEAKRAFFGQNVQFLAAEKTGAAANSAGSGVTSLTKFYPENHGFAGAIERTFLMLGQKIDCYGGSGVSRFLSSQGTPNWARSLPPGTTGQPLWTFQVRKPFEVESGEIAPWFNQPGGRLQYRTPVNLETLLKRGILQEITP